MTSGRSLAQVAVQTVAGNALESRGDAVAVEEPLEIRLSYDRDGERVEMPLSITMRTPGEDLELATGFLLSEGIIHSVKDLQDIPRPGAEEKAGERCNVISLRLRAGVRFDPKRLERHFYTTSSCGVCGKTSIAALTTRSSFKLPPTQPRVSSQVISSLPEALRSRQRVFDKTGGLHAAALFDANGQLMGLREDVGRHNAVDKLVGEQLLRGSVPLHDYLMLVSGRTSFEIIQKAVMAGIPLVAAVGAPSSLAVDLADLAGMTLLGFVRDGRFNIYSGPQRIITGGQPS